MVALLGKVRVSVVAPVCLVLGSLLFGTAVTPRPHVKASGKKPVIVVSPILPAYEWTGYGGNYSHTGISAVRSKSMGKVLWSAPLDLANYNGNDILTHYGEVAITALNTVITPLRSTNGAPYTVRGINGANGSLVWSYVSSYIEPSHSWGPSFGPTILPGLELVTYSGNQRVVIPYSPKAAWPESGGRIAIRSNSDMGTALVTKTAFYGNAAYAANPSGYDGTVKVCTPLTAGPDGSIYFGFIVENGSAPNNMLSGLAVVHPNGTSNWVSAQTLSNDTGIAEVPVNCAPALSPDGSKVYVATSTGYWGRGYLCSANAKNLAPIAHVALVDPVSGQPSTIPGDGTASPMVGPDGHVFYGVLESPWLSNDDRGWMLQFTGDLSTQLPSGAFGWDDTASIVPASMVPLYTGTSPYLICTKYNDYADFGTQPGLNKVAVLDPNVTGTDSVSGATTMKEILTLLGPTTNSGLPGVREWCINSVAVDPATKSLIVNSEDGWAYRWDMTTGLITDKIMLSQGIGEAYTPTAIAPNGTVYAVNNATLFALGPSQ